MQILENRDVWWSAAAHGGDSEDEKKDRALDHGARFYHVTLRRAACPESDREAEASVDGRGL